jgi:hypothetical protein
LISTRDMAMTAAPAMPAPAMRTQAVPFRERILLVVLYVTVLASSVAFIEPSPHDALMGVLAVTCLVAGVRFERKAALLILLLMVWNIGGLLSLLNVPTEQPAIQYVATSFYLAIAAIIFVCLFAQNTMPRLAAMRAAYILTAVIVSLEAVAGYFHLFPGSQIFLAMDRGAGTFKDPNVFGPFLIWPLLVVMQRVIAHRIKLLDLVILGILSIGLFLSFSRGAWVHMAVSVTVLLGLLFISAPNSRFRMRLVTLTVVCAVGVALVIVALLSIESVREMFQQRAQAVQYYDVGEGGRFRLQELALGALLDYPNGMGPFEFSRIHGVQQHNVYLQAFMVYGWIGGMAYLIMLGATLLFGLRTVFVATPWQPYLVTALAAFAGEVFEGAVIDSDHWRHFYLLLGMIWALSIATINTVKREPGLRAGAARIADVRGT